MESRRHHQRSRGARGPPPLPLHHHQLPRHHAPPHHPRQNPSLPPAAAAASHAFQFQMEDDANSTLMDIDDSPFAAGGAGLLDEEDGEGELLFAQHRGGRGGAAEVRGPLPFSTFYNNFDGADFDDADLA